MYEKNGTEAGGNKRRLGERRGGTTEIIIITKRQRVCVINHDGSRGDAAKCMDEQTIIIRNVPVWWPIQLRRPSGWTVWSVNTVEKNDVIYDYKQTVTKLSGRQITIVSRALCATRITVQNNEHSDKKKTQKIVSDRYGDFPVKKKNNGVHVTQKLGGQHPSMPGYRTKTMAEPHVRNDRLYHRIIVIAKHPQSENAYFNTNVSSYLCSNVLYRIRRENAEKIYRTLAAAHNFYCVFVEISQ